MKQTPRSDVFGLGALTGVTGADILADIARLAWPEREPSGQTGRLVSTEVPTKMGVMTLPEDALTKATPIGNAQPICFALTTAVEQPTPDQKGPSRRPGGRWGNRLAPVVHEATNRRGSAFEYRCKERVGGNLPLPSGDEVRGEKLSRGLGRVAWDGDLASQQLNPRPREGNEDARRWGRDARRIVWFDGVSRPWAWAPVAAAARHRC